MNNTIENESRHRYLRKRSKVKTIVLNTVAEFLAAIIFSSLYFIFISRYIADAFSMDYIGLSFAIGLVFFGAIYIPFHTYRIHVIPFISLLSAMRKRDPMILVYKVPVQILGSLIGVLVFNTLNSHTTQVNIEDYRLINFNDQRLSILVNSLTAVTLCYGYYMIRILFKAKELAGTIYLSLYFMVLFSLTSVISTVSALNPFGYLFYDLLGNKEILNQQFFFVLISHIVAPIVSVLLLFYYIKPKVFVQNKKV